jgi:hypothetical protein
MRVSVPHLNPISPLAVVSVLFLSGAAGSALAQLPSSFSEEHPIPQTALTIFSDKPMPDRLWAALDATLRDEIASGTPEIQAIAAHPTGPASGQASAGGSDRPTEIQIIRGDTIQPGFLADKVVVVFLHGDCANALIPRSNIIAHPAGPDVLGWVKKSDGHIEPFIHVDCNHIGQLLAFQAMGRKPEERDRLMATAIARVIVHEWIHIATQNPNHSGHGLFKAQFGLADLMVRQAKPVRRRQAPISGGY